MYQSQTHLSLYESRGIERADAATGGRAREVAVNERVLCPYDPMRCHTEAAVTEALGNARL